MTSWRELRRVEHPDGKKESTGLAGEQRIEREETQLFGRVAVDPPGIVVNNPLFPWQHGGTRPFSGELGQWALTLWQNKDLGPLDYELCMSSSLF